MIPGAQVLTGYQYLMSSTTSGGGSSTTNPPPLFDWRIDAFTAASAALISKDSYGNLSTVTNGGVFNEELRSLVISGGTPYPLTPVAGPNGTYLGWLGPNASGMSVFGDDNAGCFGNTACAIPARSIGPAGLAWIMGPLASPFYLSA